MNTTDHTQYAPGRSQQPWFDWPAGRGRWVWVPDWPQLPGDYIPPANPWHIPEPTWTGTHEDFPLLEVTITSTITLQ